MSFTRDGKVAVVFALAIGVAAVNTGNNLLYLLLGWLLAFIIASGVLAEITLRGLVVRRRVPANVTAGEPFFIELEVENTKRRTASFSVEVEDIAGGVALDKRCYFLKIPAGKVQRATYRHAIASRGEFCIDSCLIATRFPFSLFRKSRKLESITTVVVHPQRQASSNLAIGKLGNGDLSTSVRGRQGELHSLRPYRVGDDRKMVHWRLSAKQRQLVVRELEDQRAKQLTVVFDHAIDQFAIDSVGFAATPTEQRLNFASERAIAAAHSACQTLVERGFMVELIGRGVHVPSGSGKFHAQRLAAALASVKPTSEQVGFAAAPNPDRESILLYPRGTQWRGRPATTKVVAV